MTGDDIVKMVVLFGLTTGREGVGSIRDFADPVCIEPSRISI